MKNEDLILSNLGLLETVYRLLGVYRTNAEFEDVEGAALLGLVKAAAAFDESKARFSTYAVLRARGEVIDHFRRLNDLRSNKPVRFVTLFCARNHPSLTYIEHYDYAELHGAINRLPGKQRQAVELFYFQNKTIYEICATTGAKPSAVKMRLLKAKKAIKKELEL